MREKILAVINVSLVDDERGWLRVYSKDLPGLILCGPDRRKIGGSIKPAIRKLLEHGGLKDFTLTETTPIQDILRHPSPRTVDVNVQQQTSAKHESHTQFVVEVGELADA